MVIVRESPRSRISPDKNQVQWPPRSPFQALISSPSGRKRWQDMKDQIRDASPSPTRRREPLHESKVPTMAGNPDEGLDDEQDEEALKLKVEILQAKLKLKELEKRKKVQANSSGSSSLAAETRGCSPTRRPQVGNHQSYTRPAGVEVPLSPTKVKTALVDPVSPARARLGLKMAPNAQEVSLKRARDGTQITKAGPQASDTSRHSLRRDRPVSSFNQKLAMAQEAQQIQQVKSERIERSRRKAFGLPQTENTPADTADARPGTMGLSTYKSRDRSASPKKPKLMQSQSPSSPSKTSDLRDRRSPFRAGNESATQKGKNEPSFYDPFSEIHLSKRHVPHVDIARALHNTEIYTLPRLLKEVKSPDYEPPDCESDYVVFGILASKTMPLDQKSVHQVRDSKNDETTPKSKFMVLKLCDLKWEIDCFLFGTGFDQFWKLTEGTLLAILNPAIMPPKVNQNNGRFSLKLSSCEDRVMEIGLARDLGYCNALRKDGQPCNAWVNAKKTQICEFHVNIQIEKNRKGRMEVNGMWRGVGSPDAEKRKRMKSRPSKPLNYSREYGHLYSVNTGLGRSAATLLDADDTDALHNMTSEEASRKRIAAAQREREIAKKLGEMGGGVAADYFKAAEQARSQVDGSSTRSTRSAAFAADGIFAKPTAAELGLLGRNANEQRLSPAKDRKRHFGLGALSSTGAEALGWGGAKKPGLLQPKESRLGSPERGQARLNLQTSRDGKQGKPRDRSLSPSKKARFALAMGIREPGRESFGEDLGPQRATKKTIDEEDDDLDIV